jgi:hypothetical protein
MTAIMIVEPESGGHLMQYVRRVIREAVDRGLTVTLLTRVVSLEHPAYLALKQA